ncbi:MAG: HAD family phosphatase [Parachlamydiaceae bacterium]|nr:HAD family phosphatase [Parachlamydiaceae bacterium]
MYRLINQIQKNVILLIVFLAYGPVSLSASADLYCKTKVVIFDCDGVLVDTEYLKFLAWQEALASYMIDFSIEEYMPLVGHSSKNILAMIAWSKQLKLAEQIIDLKNDKYKALQKQGVQAIQPMADFARALSENKERLELKLGLASSAPQEEIFINLQQIGLENAFDLIVSGSDDLEDYNDEEGKNKPKPYIYIEAAKRLNVLPEFCLVFEDTAAGVEAAAGAGMTIVAVPNQFTINQDFSKASTMLHSFEELPSIEIFQK